MQHSIARSIQTTCINFTVISPTHPALMSTLQFLFVTLLLQSRSCWRRIGCYLFIGSNAAASSNTPLAPSTLLKNSTSSSLCMLYEGSRVTVLCSSLVCRVLTATGAHDSCLLKALFIPCVKLDVMAEIIPSIGAHSGVVSLRSDRSVDNLRSCSSQARPLCNACTYTSVRWRPPDTLTKVVETLSMTSVRHVLGLLCEQEMFGDSCRPSPGSPLQPNKGSWGTKSL